MSNDQSRNKANRWVNLYTNEEASRQTTAPLRTLSSEDQGIYDDSCSELLADDFSESNLSFIRSLSITSVTSSLGSSLPVTTPYGEINPNHANNNNNNMFSGTTTEESIQHYLNNSVHSNNNNNSAIMETRHPQPQHQQQQQLQYIHESASDNDSVPSSLFPQPSLNETAALAQLTSQQLDELMSLSVSLVRRLDCLEHSLFNLASSSIADSSNSDASLLRTYENGNNNDDDDDDEEDEDENDKGNSFQWLKHVWVIAIPLIVVGTIGYLTSSKRSRSRARF